jgi:hypothetical protein
VPKKLIILSLLLVVTLPGILVSQSRSAFSGDIVRFGSELTTFMGPNLNTDQKINLDLFLIRWDSSLFSNENMARIMDISSRLSSRLMRPVPHFNDYLITINDFFTSKLEVAFFNNWLIGLSEITFNPRFTNDNIDRYFRNTSSMIKDNVLFDSGSVKWKVKNSKLQFLHDTVFCVAVTDATLTCYSQRDSTEVYNVTGVYFPEIQQFRGKKGLVTWEKAGYSRNNVFAELGDYTINTTKNSFIIDSAKLIHNVYFKEPVFGLLTDQTTSFSNKDNANYPRFQTYTKHFGIKNLYDGINYDGGLYFEGANVKGTGESISPAKITLFRNDTLYIKSISREFLFSKNGLISQESAISLYFNKDSIYHSNLAISYIASTKQVNLYRTNNPNSKSPYFDSFHRLDMYFEYLSWNVNESKIILSRPRGSSMGQAQFESSSFFNSIDFMRMMGLDDYHPLNRLIKFAEWYYSEQFPVAEFAKWLKKPEEVVTGLCIDLANNGFVYYDRMNNEVTIKQKTKDFLASYAKKKDYDIINIVSKTKSPVDNAILDLKTFNLTVNGVSGVFLSDSQKVAIYPYKQQLVIGRNRSLKFDGVIEAGLLTIFGHNFSFSYDTFMLKLEKIDSIRFAVETNEKDMYGHALIANIDNLIQFGKGELYIDNPDNKSGLKSYKQYPIINSMTNSYIFYDKIAGLEGIYNQKDFYFKVDPFTIENIDHYSKEQINFPGEFYGGNILKPMKQNLTVQENNSLGFNMIIPGEGIEVYGDKGRLFETINMSNKGLIGSGTMKYLTSTTVSNHYSFFPDSMITKASAFNLQNDGSGKFPNITGQDVTIKWLPVKNQYLAANTPGKSFKMFENGTTLDGTIDLSPSVLRGKGILNMPDSKITSNLYSFAQNSIKADTADYNLKSRTTSGYSFIAENASTDINFETRTARFRLNTDSSMVKFPELQYICTMTDFSYNMENRVLSMEQKGKSDTPLLSTDKLLRLDLKNLDKPTFFATNNLSDTVAFSSWKGSYNLDQEFIEAENINYIRVADALIQPEKGKVIINRRAKIQQLQNAIIALNNRHILHSAKIDIESTKRYSGSAVYNYVNENNEIQQISFPELTVDTLTTTAKGYIPVTQNFMLNPAFSFSGDVKLSANDNFLYYTGAAGIIHNCTPIKSYSIKFNSAIDPKNVMIPVSEKPRDINDNLVFSGSYISTDSTRIYPAFLSAQKNWTDVALVNSNGWLWFEKAKGRYLITSLEKLADQSLPGNMIALDKNFCVLSGEGNLNFGVKYDLVNLAGAGKIIHSIDSAKVDIEAILAMDFYFSAEALKMMADEIRMMPSLKPVNLNTDLNNKGMKDLIGTPAALKMKEEMDLFGSTRGFTKDFSYKLLLNDVNLYWNESTSSFISQGKIGIGLIGQQPLNVFVDGYVEIRRRRSGDMIDIYLKADESVWYYFSYFRGVMMSQAGNLNYNRILNNTKLTERKHPESSVRVPYTYMIASEDRLSSFLRRMAGDNSEDVPVR